MHLDTQQVTAKDNKDMVSAAIPNMKQHPVTRKHRNAATVEVCTLYGTFTAKRETKQATSSNEKESIHPYSSPNNAQQQNLHTTV
jgi:hypothetical protein